MAAIKYPEVGKMMFPISSAIEKERTAVCRVTPTKSAKGAIKGIVKAACPISEETIK